MKRREENEKGPDVIVPGPTGARRRTLLAKIHIASKDLGISDSDYRGLLAREFGVHSAADLSTDEMERLLGHFAARGWRPIRSNPRRASPAAGRPGKQAFALQARVREALSQLEDSDERRLHGLCEKICGSKDLASCRDIEKLRRVLAVLAGIRKSESNHGQTLH